MGSRHGQRAAERFTLPPLVPPPPASSAAVRAVMQGNRGKDTKPEAAIRSALHRAGCRFRKHYRPLRGLRCEVDVAFPRQRVLLFIDGCFWHACPVHGRTPKGNETYWSAKIGRNVARDRRNDALLQEAGWTVIRAWEHEEPDVVVARVRAALERSGG